MQNNQLKEWRGKRTQKEAAQELGCTERYYQGMEAGQYKPSSIMQRLIDIVTESDAEK